MELLFVLALLACPVGMGAMMWFMSKGMMGGNKQKDDASSTQDGSLQDLRKQQHELAADIARLEEHQVPEREPAPAAGR
jgi:flagellar basal body-associated protein FliL